MHLAVLWQLFFLVYFYSWVLFLLFKKLYLLVTQSELFPFPLSTIFKQLFLSFKRKYFSCVWVCVSQRRRGVEGRCGWQLSGRLRGLGLEQGAREAVQVCCVRDACGLSGSTLARSWRRAWNPGAPGGVAEVLGSSCPLAVAGGSSQIVSFENIVLSNKTHRVPSLYCQNFTFV